MCYMEPNCVSINLGPLEGGKHKCELNNATAENQFASHLQNEPTFTYLAIEVMYIMHDRNIAQLEFIKYLRQYAHSYWSIGVFR